MICTLLLLYMYCIVFIVCHNQMNFSFIDICCKQVDRIDFCKHVLRSGRLFVIFLFTI